MRALLVVCLAASMSSAGFAAVGPEGGTSVAEDRPAPRALEDRVVFRLSPAAAMRARTVLEYAEKRARATGPRSGRIELAGLDVPSVDAIARDLGLRFEPAFDREPPSGSEGRTDLTAWWVAKLPSAVALDHVLARLGSAPDVERVEEVALVPVEAMPGDSLWSSAWWAYQTSRRDLHMPEAWDVTRGDTSVVIAILDTGVIPYHPDLGGRVAGLSGNLFTNWLERAGLAGVDDDDNGFVDDVYGWDFVDLASTQDVYAGEDWDDEDADPNDFAGHGTAVAGLASALTDNGDGIASAGWRCRLLPVRVGWSATYFPLGVVDMLSAARGVRYATRMGASVINCSFASVQTSVLADAVAAAVDAGVTVVAAAGNNGSSHWLGDREDVLAVAATDATDRVAAFSNLGAYVDVSAPGVNVPTTTLKRVEPDSIGQRQPNYSVSANGTSFSAPLAAGVVALLQAARRAAGLRPLDPMEAVLRVRETADDIRLRNTVVGYGTGRVNALRALTDPPTSRVFRLGSPTTGGAVVLEAKDGPPRIAVVTEDAHLVILDSASGDTLRLVALPGPPGSSLAAADLGGSRGVGLFVGTLNGRVAGYYANGDPRPGWPVAPSGEGEFIAGPALGDLDGDGAVEVVCGTASGALWAWRADGSVAPGFPRRDQQGPFVGGIALGPLESLAPGLAIVGINNFGIGRAWRGDGTPLPGWPIDLGTLGSPYSPLIGRLSHTGPVVAILPVGRRSEAYTAAGTHVFTATYSGLLAAEPALADVNGDGADDLVSAVLLLNALHVTDSTGLSVDLAAWPRSLDDSPTGAPAVGPLVPGGGTGVLLRRGYSLLAMDAHADEVESFPKPGGRGIELTLADLDDDGATEVITEAGEDGRLYIYDAGPGTWATRSGWPTARGNFARTGSHVGAPALTPVDAFPPAPIVDLRVARAGRDQVRLAWTSVGDDASTGTPERYLVTATGLAGPGAGGVVTASITACPVSGEAMSYDLVGLASQTRYAFGVVAVDGSGNRGPASNSVEAITVPGPGAGSRFAIGPREQPSGLPVVWLWNGVAGRPHEIRILDLAGRRVRLLAAGSGSTGEVVWDGRGDHGERLRPGIYVAELASGLLRARARVVLVE